MAAAMVRTNADRIDNKRKINISHRKRQFAEATYKHQDYPYRLNFYELPPTADITLEQFEQWAIDRLRVLAELEACSFRNRTPAETEIHMAPILQKYLPLRQNSATSQGAGNELLKEERRKDHYSHFILRLAFSQTEDLRRRFLRNETALWRLRFAKDDGRERQAFIESLEFDWNMISEMEKRDLGLDIYQTDSTKRGVGSQEDTAWFKVDWERVPELVENRKVLVRAGKAYVPGKEQASMIVSEFHNRLEKSLELTARALPRLDEDDRLTPILNHLSKSFATPDSTISDSESTLQGTHVNAGSVEALSQHFPLCMRNLHMTLRQNSHLKHFGRLQYTLFLKGLGMTMEDCVLFWRQSFNKITDDTFNKEYRYNIRHSYGDVGGDANRRGRGYSPFSCQKILTEHPPGSGESHGCPYRHFSIENLTALLQKTGISDRDLLRNIAEGVDKQRYHIACNMVFEHAHKAEIKKVKDEGTWSAADLDVIVHPNTYFKRSYMLKRGIPLQGKSLSEE